MIEIIFAPRDRWLAYLADGWTFCNGIAEPMPGSHGDWSVMLERPDSTEKMQRT